MTWTKKTDSTNAVPVWAAAGDLCSLTKFRTLLAALKNRLDIKRSWWQLQTGGAGRITNKTPFYDGSRREYGIETFLVESFQTVFCVGFGFTPVIIVAFLKTRTLTVGKRRSHGVLLCSVVGDAPLPLLNRRRLRLSGELSPKSIRSNGR